MSFINNGNNKGNPVNLVTLEELKNSYLTIDQIPYSELIRTKEWFEKRDKIIKRDNYKCKICGTKETISFRGIHYFVDGMKWDTIIQNGVEKKYTFPDVKFKTKQFYLHVHHKYYILNELPWEIEDDGLVTLCNWCHWVFHENNSVTCYERTNNGLNELCLTPCKRCNAAGYFPEYYHISKGICFRCRGKKFEEFI